MRRAVVGASAAVALAGVGVAGLAIRSQEAPSARAADADAPAAAETISLAKRDLIETDDEDATLGFADPLAIGSRRAGTLTWAPDGGSVVRPGGVLYRVDTRPVFLFAGGQPAWRALEDGVDDGLDVRQLEQDLVALGYDPDHAIDVDTTFDDDTADAVERWQEATHQEETGKVELGTVVFLPGPRRVGSVDAAVGGPVGPGATVLSTTATRREATFKLNAADAGLVAEDQRVTVTLPDGSTVPARIAGVGRVASDESDQGGGDSTPQIEVTVRLPEGQGVSAFDQAPVTVTIETGGVRDALAAPVTALVALAGGGYAVEVVGSSGHHLVAATVGAFADGYVQVTGPGLAVGTRVAVAES